MSKDYAHELTDDEHRDLAEVLNEVDGMVVLSGYRSALYDELYAGWLAHERKSLADGARPRIEVVWLNAAAVGALNESRRQLDWLGAAE